MTKDRKGQFGYAQHCLAFLGKKAVFQGCRPGFFQIGKLCPCGLGLGQPVFSGFRRLIGQQDHPGNRLLQGHQRAQTDRKKHGLRRILLGHNHDIATGMDCYMTGLANFLAKIKQSIRRSLDQAFCGRVSKPQFKQFQCQGKDIAVIFPEYVFTLLEAYQHAKYLVDAAPHFCGNTLGCHTFCLQRQQLEYIKPLLQGRCLIAAALRFGGFSGGSFLCFCRFGRHLYCFRL